MNILYSKSSDKDLSRNLFKNPTAEYRGVPFWAWNSKLEPGRLARQIECFREMGFGGFFMHSRSGMAMQYLGDEFMRSIKWCIKKAEEKGMRAWLYDEDRWPSGTAGGYVTSDHRYRMRYLLFTPWAYGDPDAVSAKFINDGRANVSRQENGVLLARYDIVLEGGMLAKYRRMADGESAHEGRIWYAYLEIAGDNSWFNDQAYLNTLDPRAVDRFIEVTYERYYSQVGSEFASTIPAIFTDEPQFCQKVVLEFSDEQKDAILPWTEGFESIYETSYGNNILDTLPEVFWELPYGRPSVARYRYHNLVTELFSRNFAERVGGWCAAHGLMLTGHMMEEPTLESQTRTLGEAMRPLQYFQIPGIDMLCDWREFSTAKQAQSIARQKGTPGMASEMYGVTGWHFDFRGHKLQGDWQAALGVTVRVPHLAWYSMSGEGKRDYPASIGYQSPWYREYKSVEDHFARINTAMTRGEPLVRIAVVHPIESYWLSYGPAERTMTDREELESNFSNLIEWLLFGLLDFDFLAESIIAEPGKTEVLGRSAHSERPTLRVGRMNYQAVVVPPCRTLRSSTVFLLTRFAEAGGRVVFLGEVPALVDAELSDKAKQLTKLYAEAVVVPFSRARLLSELSAFRDVEVRRENGAPHDNVFYQMRADGERRWLFLCHVRHPTNPDLPDEERSIVRIRGSWSVDLWDSADGSVNPVDTALSVDSLSGVVSTNFECAWFAHDSLLLSLNPRHTVGTAPKSPAALPLYRMPASAVLTAVRSSTLVEGPVEISLSEPNVLLLDIAEYQIEGGSWQPREELLRIDNIAREQFGWKPRESAMAQPWLDDGPVERRHVRLRYSFYSEIAVSGCELAIENRTNACIKLNGDTLLSAPDGWFVDEDIARIPLPKIPKGESILEVDQIITRRLGLEWMYILGDFGVAVSGSHAKITAPVKALDFGDWTGMGLPFYAGNVGYRFSVEGGSSLAIQITQFRNPLLSATLDGRFAGRIAYAPYLLNLGKLSAGRHELVITAFGNRANAFGPVHNCDEHYLWFGPDSWRTKGYSWSYEYRLRPMGILSAPRLLRE